MATAHTGQGRLAHRGETEHVDVETRPDLINRECFRHADRHDAGIVHKDIKGALQFDFGGNPRAIMGRGHIEFHNAE